MVSDYNKECKYIDNRLKDCIYLVSADHLKEIFIDNGNAYISGLTETPYAIEGFNIQFTEEETLNGDYRFTKRITMSVKGYFTLSNLNEKYYAIVETVDNVKYMVNIDFPSYVTYSYKLDDNSNDTDITFSTQSNYPSLMLMDDFEYNPICNGYSVKGIDKIQLIENKYATIDVANREIVTSTSPKKIEFSSAEFTEEFDGEKVTDTLSFKIGINENYPSFQWNMLEFRDNKYVAIVNSKNHTNVFYLGFNFGLSPSYSIAQSSSKGGNDNGITITLTEVSQFGSTVTTELEILQKTYRGWNNLKQYNDIICYECTSNFGEAKYLVKEEVDYFGNPTGNYKVLEGYESQFSFLNIVGTFDEADTFKTYECISEDDCFVTTNIPSLIEYSAATCYTFSLDSVCPFSFENIPDNIEVTPISGDSGSHTIEICQIFTPTTSLVEGNMTLNYGSHSDVITIKTQLPVANIRPTTVYINCMEQEVSFIFNNNCRAYLSDNPSNLTYTVASNALVVKIPSNTSTSYRTFYLEATDCYNVTTPLYIIQSQLYENWVEEDGFICISGDSYHIERRYTGVTYGDWSATNETRIGNLIQTGDTNCSDEMTKWEFDGNYLCEGGNKFEAIEEFVSYDNGSNWTRTGNITLGDFVESGSSFCEESTSYDWVLSSEYQCSGTTSYYLYQHYIKIGSQQYIPTYPTEYSIDGEGTETAVVKTTNDVQCGYMPPSTPIYRWFEMNASTDYICDECSKIRLVYDDSTAYDVDCDTTTTLRQSDVSGGTNPISAITMAYIGGCITSIGSKAFSGCSNMTDCNIPTGVTSIGSSAFTYCSGLTAIDIPNTVESIGVSCFRFCGGAKTLHLSYRLEEIPVAAFLSCSGLTSISIPNSVRDIGNNSFSYCYSAKSLFLGYGVNRIGAYAFSNCSGITSLSIPFTINSIETGAFDNCSGLTAVDFGYPLSAVTIGSLAFRRCSSLREINIPNVVTSIGSDAFQYCTSMTAATIGSGVTSIGSNAFYGDSALTKVKVYAVTPPTLGGNAFYNTNNCPIYVPSESVAAYKSSWSTYESRIYPMATKFTLIYYDSDDYSLDCNEFNSISAAEVDDGTSTRDNIITAVLGECVEIIDRNAFKGCTAMTTLPNLTGITEIGTSAFSGCTALNPIILPNNVEAIGSSAFSYCSDSTVLEIGSGLTEISNSAFLGCSSLTAITVPNNVQIIRNNAFSGCSAATSVAIGNGVSQIGARAFKDCSGLTAITINSVEPPLLGDFTFDNTNNCPIYVPSSAVNTYKSTLWWQQYSDRIYSLGTKFTLTYSDSTTYIFDCNSIASLTNNEVNSGTKPITAITSVVVEECVTSIGSYAFEGCSGMTSILLPNTIDSINVGAFSNCSGLTSITITATIPPSLGNPNVFNNTNDCPIYVPSESVEVYKSASRWSRYADRITAIT